MTDALTQIKTIAAKEIHDAVRVHLLTVLAGFLVLDSPRAQALSENLLAAGVTSDARGRSLRLGPAPYLCDEQIGRAVGLLGEVARTL